MLLWVHTSWVCEWKEGLNIDKGLFFCNGCVCIAHLPCWVCFTWGSNRRLFIAAKETPPCAQILPAPRLGRMAGTRSMTEKTRFTAPEALVRSGKAICALAMPIAANAMAKKTCMPAHMQASGNNLIIEAARFICYHFAALLLTAFARLEGASPHGLICYLHTLHAIAHFVLYANLPVPPPSPPSL